MTSCQGLRVFVPSAADVLTDHVGHGEGLIAFNLLSELTARGHQVVACARRLDFQAPPPFEAIGLGDGGPLESLRAPVYAAAVRHALRRLGGPRRFDVAHWIFPNGRDNQLDSLPRRLPLVIGPLPLLWPGAPSEFHAGDVLRWLADPVHRILHSRGMRRAELLVAVPEAVGDYPRDLASSCTVVPYGIDAERYAVRPLPGIPTVLFLGRLEPTKGIQHLYAAFRRLRARVPAARLRIAGEGSLHGWLEDRVESDGLRQEVELLGAVANREVPALLDASSLLCVPSTGETFGMVYLEAMAAGRAVVAGDWGGPRHLVRREGGRRVAYGDVATLAQALQELLTQPSLLESCGRFNRGRVLREFTWTNIADQLEGVYEKAIGS